jgi:parallel beta-helix repeat protein
MLRNDHTFSRRAVIAGFAAVPTLSATTALADADSVLNAASQALDQVVIGAPIKSEWPNASTTGVVTGVSLTNSSNVTSSSIGQIIEGLNVNGIIIVKHTGVTIRNCRAYNISVNGPNATVENCTVVGGDTNSGIGIQFGDGAAIQRCDISGVENGFWLESNGCLIADNYIHDLEGSPGDHDPHIDGLQIPGNNPKISNNIIRHNNFDLNITNTSSCITMADATNIHIENNRLNGGAYSVYFEGSTTGCTVTNNLFIEHAFGYVAGKAVRAQTYRDNIFAGRGSHPRTK